MDSLDKPLNTEERYLHAIAVQLNAIAHMLSSFIEVYAEKNDVATTSNTVEEKPAQKKAQPKKTKKK